MFSIITLKGQSPHVHESVFLAPGSFLIGDVQISEGSSVWFNSVLRGDILSIQIGKNSNIQDLSMIHTSTGVSPCVIGDEVTVGHRVILHGCQISSRVIVGMGSILMDGAQIGEDVIIGAGSIVTEKMVLPPRTLALGSPCRVKRDLNEQEISFIRLSALNYQERAKEYLLTSRLKTL